MEPAAPQIDRDDTGTPQPNPSQPNPSQPSPSQHASSQPGAIASWTGEVACGLALVMTGALFALGGRAMSLFEDGVPGPGLLPVIAGLLLAALGLWIALAAAGLRSRAPVRVFDRDSLLAASLMGAAIFAFEYAGYVLSTFVFLCTSFLLIGRARPLPAILVAAAATVMTWVLFVKALGVGLPAGLLPLPW